MDRVPDIMHMSAAATPLSSPSGIPVVFDGHPAAAAAAAAMTEQHACSACTETHPVSILLHTFYVKDLVLAAREFKCLPAPSLGDQIDPAEELHGLLPSRAQEEVANMIRKAGVWLHHVAADANTHGWQCDLRAAVLFFVCDEVHESPNTWGFMWDTLTELRVAALSYLCYAYLTTQRWPDIGVFLGRQEVSATATTLCRQGLRARHLQQGGAVGSVWGP